MCLGQPQNYFVNQSVLVKVTGNTKRVKTEKLSQLNNSLTNYVAARTIIASAIVMVLECVGEFSHKHY